MKIPRPLVVLAALVATAAFAEPITSQQFVTRAAQLGAAEVAAAKLAVDRSASDEVKKFAGEMIVDHTVAQDELAKIAGAKGWTVPQGGEEPPELAKLREASGEAFDQAYVELQVAGHERMIALLEQQVEASQDARLKAWAEKQLPIVREHLREAKTLAGDEKGAGPAH